METNHERCGRLLVAVETLVEEECFAATRGDWGDVLAMQRRADPLLKDLDGLLADGGISSLQLERVVPRLQVLQRQHAEILGHIDARKSGLASRLAAVDAASGRLAGMKRAYGPPADRRGAGPATLCESA